MLQGSSNLGTPCTTYHGRSMNRRSVSSGLSCPLETFWHRGAYSGVWGSARNEEDLMRRILIATLFGLVAGGMCATGAFAGHLLPFSTIALGWILLNRAVMGFVIGASGLKLHWVWNGLVMGLVVGEIFSYFLFMDLGVKWLLISPVSNALFGLMIEFFTTVVFRQRAGAVAMRVVA